MPIRRLLAIVTLLITPSIARADLPEIVDRVPGDARAVVVIPSVNELDDAVSQLLVAMEQGEASTPKQLLRIVGIAGAIDARRPIAVFWHAGSGENPVPMLAALVPTLNVKRAMESLNASKGADEIYSFEAGSRTWFVRALTENDLIVGMEPRSLASYEPVSGQTEAHKALMGASGYAAADGSHLMMWGHMEEFRPMVRGWLDKAEATLTQFKGAMGTTATPGADPIFAFIDTLTDAAARDADFFTIALRADGTGLTSQLAASFKPGSQMERAASADRAQRTEETPAMFDGLPALPFLLAMGVDASHEGVRTIASQATGATGDTPTALHTADAIAIAAYQPQGPIVIEGALSRVLVHWRAENTSDTAMWFKSYIKSLDGAGGARIAYDDATGQLAGVTIDRWSMALPNTGQRSTQMLYGQNGSPRGVVAARETDGYISAAPDELITNILKGRAAGDLSGNAQIRELAARMPNDPVAQGFLNFRPMLMQAMPVLAMMGINLDVPLRLPPIAASVSMHQGQAHAGAFVPAYALKLGWQFYAAYQAMNAPQPEPEPTPGVTPSRQR